MTNDPTILDLIHNGTLSAEVAATLWAAVDARRSFLVVAIPRLAGKTTTTNALLGLLPPDVPIHHLSGSEDEMDQLKKAAIGGYLVVSEISQGPFSSYIWGSPVRRVFDTLTAGYALTAAMHASGLEEAIADICQGNGVSDEAASRVHLLLYIRRFGAGVRTFWRRLAEVHEIDRVKNGRPQARLLHRWVAEDDRFETVEAPRAFGTNAADLARRASLLRELAGAGRTAQANVTELVTRFHGRRMR
ncbi:MAG: hypothetical protein HYY31_04605 [Chloroflexi bacterium]|nr:hypothetical protein [Chloroflexota bacterium]